MAQTVAFSAQLAFEAKERPYHLLHTTGRVLDGLCSGPRPVPSERP